MHTNACEFAISWSSLMYLAPSDFFGLEHLASSYRSVFDDSVSSRESSSTALAGGTGQASAAEPWRPRAPISNHPEVFPLLRLPPLHSFARGLRRCSSNTSASVVLSQLENLRCGGSCGVLPEINAELRQRIDVNRPASGRNNQRRNDTQCAIYKAVSKIDSRLTDSAFSFRLLFSFFSILSSLLRLLVPKCFRILLFFLPSSFSECFLG